MDRQELMDFYKHPRVMELRLSIFYTKLRQEYGYNEIINIFEGLAKAFRCAWTPIKGLMDNMHQIKKLKKRDWLRYRQEMIFVCWLQGKTKVEIARDINVKPYTLYLKKYPINPEEFVDGVWLSKLEDSVTLAGIPQYKIELYKFINGLDSLMEAL